ncbi:hypothetical protein, conserved [Babesia bigemina]|uniref:K Homology domain-containing protein n=1 Tax=Babesia bigemina TaxID=5866 RepID=A0A061DBQ5_BABBI|nr:hypothetical protein, conserved [Babesia bigemina]CDR97387.1 hypothetical protein, conserved [Babesia bigemina]|eukprot:XP_012769573.1 hypothetical protein, conserved [Babesia bigemina]
MADNLKVGPDPSKEFRYLNAVDLKFSHAEDTRLRRRTPTSDGATVVGFSEQAPWRNGSSELRRGAESKRDAESPAEVTTKVDASMRSLSIDSDKSSCALYNYFSRPNGEGCTSLSSWNSNSTESLNFERYRDMMDDSATLRSPSASLEKELIHMVESAWKSAAPKRETAPVYQNKGKNVFLKILATQLVSGTIIGRGGKGFNWFRRKSKIDDILLSMPWELYPKTDLRTMFLEGTTAAVVKATCIIADLMLSKYAAQHSATVTQSDRMLVLVVLPLFAKTAMERIRDTSDADIISITLFQSSTEHNEIVAVIKGVKSKVKALVGAIANSIAETIDLQDYCHVSYPGPDGFNPKMLPKNRAVQRNAMSGNEEAAEAIESAPKKIDDNSETSMETPDPSHQLRQGTDSETQTETCAVDLSETVHTMADMGYEIPHENEIQLNMATAAVVAESNPTINSYPINLNILVPAAKAADAMSITSASKCYVTTAPAEDPNTLVFSLSGSFEETVAVVSLIMSVM